jgi:hypothetical protein
MAKFKAKKTRAKKAKKPKRPRARKSTGTKKKSNAWRAYVGGGVSNAPLPP